jgi:hypothetical protein
MAEVNVVLGTGPLVWRLRASLLAEESGYVS